MVLKGEKIRWPFPKVDQLYSIINAISKEFKVMYKGVEGISNMIIKTGAFFVNADEVLTFIKKISSCIYASDSL